METVKFLNKSGKQVIIIDPVPEFNFEVPIELSKNYKITGKSVCENLKISDYYERNHEFFDALKSINEDNYTRVELLEKFCNTGECLAYNADGLPLYNDGNHLTALGQSYVADDIKFSIVDLLKQKK